MKFSKLQLLCECHHIDFDYVHVCRCGRNGQSRNIERKSEYPEGCKEGADRYVCRYVDRLTGQLIFPPVCFSHFFLCLLLSESLPYPSFFFLLCSSLSSLHNFTRHRERKSRKERMDYQYSYAHIFTVTLSVFFMVS